MCDSCGELHEEDVVVELMGHSMEAKPIVLGAHIGALPRLEVLALDFAGYYELGLNSALNCFQWPAGGGLPALRTLRLQALGLGRCPAFGINWGTAPWSGAELALNPNFLATAFDAMPALHAVHMELPCPLRSKPPPTISAAGAQLEVQVSEQGGDFELTMINPNRAED
jgi:hypothetical protein